MEHDARLQAIVKTAAALFASRGYERTSIRDVAKAAGMSVAGLYYYVRSKEELLYHICSRSFSVLLEALEAELATIRDPRARVHALIRNHLTHFLRDMNEIKVITRELGALRGQHAAEVAVLRHRYYEICRSVLAELGTNRIPLRLAAMSLFGMINWIHMWYRPEVDGGADALAEGMTRVFLDGYSSSGAEEEPWRATAATSS